jgi:hypothetical protein
MNQQAHKTAGMTLIGVAAATMISLTYGLINPESLTFSIPFLIAPSLMLLAAAGAGDRALARRAGWVAAGVVVATVAVLLLTTIGA